LRPLSALKGRFTAPGPDFRAAPPKWGRSLIPLQITLCSPEEVVRDDGEFLGRSFAYFIQVGSPPLHSIGFPRRSRCFLVCCTRQKSQDFPKPRKTRDFPDFGRFSDPCPWARVPEKTVPSGDTNLNGPQHTLYRISTRPPPQTHWVFNPR